MSGTPLRLALLASVRWYNACAAYAVELAHALAESGHDVRLVVQPGSPAEVAARAKGLHVVSRWDLTRTSAGLFRTVHELRAWLREFAPHAVNAHRGEDHVLAAAALRGTGIPLIRTRGDVRPPRTGPGPRFLYRRKTAAHIATSDFMPERFYRPLGIPPESVVVIRPGLDVDRFRGGAPDREEARSILGLEPDAFWIGVVGRRTRAKGLLVALDALPSIPGARLLLCGEPVEFGDTDLASAAAARGVEDRIALRPRLDDVRTALRSLDLLLVPSLGSEAISRIAMEGQALGLPVVASDVNALPEVVGASTGTIVSAGDAEALAAAVHGWNDRIRRETVRETGPERVRHRYDRARQVALTEELVLRTRRL